MASERVLDELRAKSQPLGHSHIRVVTMEDIDAFEAAHPGLVDRTERCAFCGKPLEHDEDGEVDWETVPVLAYDDGSPMYGCKVCAREAPDA